MHFPRVERSVWLWVVCNPISLISLRQGCSCYNFVLCLFCFSFTLAMGCLQKRIQKFEHISKLGLPYAPSTLVWTKVSLDKYSIVYCLPYLPIQKVWTYWNKSLHFNIYFLNFIRALLVNNQIDYHQGHLKMEDFHRDDLRTTRKRSLL